MTMMVFGPMTPSPSGIVLRVGPRSVYIDRELGSYAGHIELPIVGWVELSEVSDNHTDLSDFKRNCRVPEYDPVVAVNNRAFPLSFILEEPGGWDFPESCFDNDGKLIYGIEHKV